MNSSSIRALASLAVASLAVTGVTSTAEATVTYANKGTAQLYDIVEAEYVLNDTRIVVLSNDTSNAVIQLVNPTDRSVTDTLAFTALNADGSNPWDTAKDMAISPNGQTAYVVFAGSNPALAKINLSTLTVSDFVSISGGNAISDSGSGPEFVGLRGSDVVAASHVAMRPYATGTLDPSGEGYGTAPEVGVTINGFVSDAVSSTTFWPDITDGGYSGNSRINFLYSNLIMYASFFASDSIASALEVNPTLGDLFVGTDLSGEGFLARISDYSDPLNLQSDGILSLGETFGSVRQISVSTDGTQLVALSNNGRIARMPLGRGWLSSLVDHYDVASASVTLGTSPVIAVTSDGSQVTYLDSQSGSQDNIVNFALANDAATVSTVPVELGWYASNKKIATLTWGVPVDNGGSPILDYKVQCTNGKSKAFKTVKTAQAEEYPGTTVRRNAKKKIKCRVLARNAQGLSGISNVITVTAQGKRGPGPF
jgi:hypothetical protein